MTPKQALALVIQAADLAPLPGPERRKWEQAAQVLSEFIKQADRPTERPEEVPAGD